MIERRASRPPKVGIVSIGSDDWRAPHWRGSHHVVSRLAERFEVVWMDPPHERGEIGRKVRRPTWLESPGDAPPNLVVYRPPFWLPTVYRFPRLDRALHRRRLAAARAHLVRRGCERLVAYLWRPLFADAVDLVDWDLTCYHIEDEYTFSDVDVPIPPEERALIERVDEVFIHSPGLMEKKGHLNPRTSMIPHGVDYTGYATPRPEPEDLAHVPRPRIGYLGYLKKQLDFSLLVPLARRHPEWSFVFVGGIGSHPEIERPLAELRSLPNVHLLGAKPTEDVAPYPQHMDVCILPYDRTDYLEYIYPLKLHEYLASGTPVVGVPIRSLVGFDDLILLAETVDEWSAALREALSGQANTVDAVEARRAVAREHDWSEIVGRVACRILERLDSRVEDSPG